MEELLKSLHKSVETLHETISARFATPDPKVAEAEKNALVELVLSKMAAAGYRKEPVQRTMRWDVKGAKNEEGAELIPFNHFLRAVNKKNDAFLNAMAKAASGQSSGTSADGGYTVPTEYASMIVEQERIWGIARRLAESLPMGAGTRNIPRELTAPTVYWAAEGTEPAALSKGTLSQHVQTAKKLTAIVPFTEELLEDNAVNYDAFIARAVAKSMGLEEDKIAFVGSVSGNSDPFNGVMFASGVNDITLDGADIAYVDLVNLIYGVNAAYRSRVTVITSTTGLKKIMKLVDGNNRPLWSLPEAGQPGRILGRPYEETSQIPDVLGAAARTGGTNTGIIAGAFDGMLISPRGGYTVRASDSASDAAGNSAFTKDEIWFKFRRRQDISVVNPEAFARLQFPAA